MYGLLTMNQMLLKEPLGHMKVRSSPALTVILCLQQKKYLTASTTTARADQMSAQKLNSTRLTEACSLLRESKKPASVVWKVRIGTAPEPLVLQRNTHPFSNLPFVFSSVPRSCEFIAVRVSLAEPRLLLP